MVDSDFENFEQIWRHLSEIYGKANPSRITMKIIFSSLMPYTMEQIRRAASYYIRTGKFMPRPADLSEIIAGTANDRARAAFIESANAAERFGSWPSVKFTDENIMMVIHAMGGWAEFCHWLKINRAQTENRFIKWYESAQSITKKTFPPVLKGEDNLAKNYKEVVCDVNVCSLPVLRSDD